MQEYTVTFKCEGSIVIEAENEDDARCKFWEPENISYAADVINEADFEVTDAFPSAEQ